MGTGLLALAGLAYFMIHEFEEIAFIRPWLVTTEGKPHMRDMWSARRWAYPSSGAIALMVAEEFALVVLILGLGVAASWPELIIGAFIAHGLHLFVHVADAIRVRRWSPGSVTAVATFPPIAATVWWFATYNSVKPAWVAANTVIIAAVMLPNLIMLHHLAPRLHGFISRAYRRADIDPAHAVPHV